MGDPIVTKHVDIWIPKHKIGIEYQGVQHDKPIEYFVGDIKKERKEMKEKNVCFNLN